MVQTGNNKYFYVREVTLPKALRKMADQIQHTEIEYLCLPAEMVLHTRWDEELDIWHLTFYYDHDNDVSDQN